MSRASSLREVRRLGAAELKALVPAWEELAAAASEPNPFYESWALLPALEAFPDPGLVCAAVFRDGRLDALFPLERAPRYRGLPVRVLRSWRHKHMLLCTPLVRAGAERECFEALLRWARAGGGASVLELEYLNGDGPVRAGLRSALEAAGRAWNVDYRYERPLLARAASADAHFAAIEKRWYGDLRRRERRLKETGRVEYPRLAAGGDIGRWIQDFLAVEQSGWKGKAGGALACHDADRRFAEAVFRGAFERGRLLAVGVDVDKRPIAREMCVCGGEGAFSWKVAYDEAYGKFAPGMLNELEALRAFQDAGLQWMDSYTGPDNEKLAKLWPGRRGIERISAPVDAWGAFMLSLLPLARWAKQKLAKPQIKGAQPVAAPLVQR